MSASTAIATATVAKPSAARSAIEVSALTFNYGERRALDGVSFAIDEGEIFGFLGPNGGGKTTLFKILSTLIAPSSGSARIMGHELGADLRELRRRIGVVFQHPSVDGKLTLRENLEHHGRLYGIRGTSLRERCAALIHRFGLEGRESDLVETLSGGLQRRVELAKALLHQPRLLLLDEPSSGLDPGARRELGNYLAHLRERDGVTVVLTTHSIEEAERCDRLGIMHQGKLVANAPPAQLKERIGGDIVVIHAAQPQALAPRIASRFGVEAAVVQGTVRVERARGHELLREVVEAFGAEIESVSFGKPTLEDVFVHLTGHQFFDEGGETTR